jgi:hypothetical protein
MSNEGPFVRLLKVLMPDVISDLSSCDGENAHIAAAAIVQKALSSSAAFHEEVSMLTDPTVEGCRCRPAIADEEARRGRAAYAAGDVAVAAEHFSVALAETDATAQGGGAAAAKLFANRAACFLRMRDAGVVALAAVDAEEVALPAGISVLAVLLACLSRFSMSNRCSSPHYPPQIST